LAVSIVTLWMLVIGTAGRNPSIQAVGRCRIVARSTFGHERCQAIQRGPSVRQASSHSAAGDDPGCWPQQRSAPVSETILQRVAGSRSVGLSYARQGGGGSAEPSVVCFPFVGHCPVGGSHVSAAKLIQNLDPKRYRPLAVLHELDGDVATLLRAAGIPFEPAPHEGFLAGRGVAADAAFLFSETWRFARFLRGRGVRIVHTNDGATHATWAMPTWFGGAKLLWHHRKDPEAKGLRFVAPWAADRVLSVSRFSAPRPGLFSAARKCTVVHSPFDTGAAPVDRGASRRHLTDELGCPPDTAVVGFFGNLIKRKRPLVFVDTIAELRKRAPDLPLVAPIFGQDTDGMTAAIEERAVAKGVADCVHLMGFRFPPEQWMAACDVLLVPAVAEPFGRTLIEAMLLGTVVVAAASGGNLEAIRDGCTGFLARPDDGAALAEPTLRVLTSPDLRKSVVSAAQEEAVARFGLRQHADAVMAVYDTMLGRGPSRGAGAPQGSRDGGGNRRHASIAIQPGLMGGASIEDGQRGGV
jgi:glycosyltransferase involved in cell wall biosynthesis